ncbi:MAG: carboxypeptidase-like regulatory domain-containing protein, partial [Prevotella sp.]|nr:carboxypeptidase-like regulatory domain-containing protein [Prevotella sp.]
MKQIFKKMKSRCFLITAMLMLSCILHAQQAGKTATGTVVDESGEPLTGVTVLTVSKLSHGTSTDFEGNFKLDDVKVGETLQFKLVGMKTAEIVFKGEPLRVILQEDAVLMNE